MSSIYAEKTSVSVEQTKVELDRLLLKHGAGQRGMAHDDSGGMGIVLFSLSGVQVRLQVPLPKIDAYRLDHNHRTRTREDQVKHWEQACRQRWRCMLLIVKAKLELIAMKMSTVDREFLADIALPDGRSVHEWLKPGIDAAYISGHMPPMLGMGRPGGFMITHVDDYIEGIDGEDAYAQFVLNFFRLPAMQRWRWNKWIKQHRLFCTHEGVRYRVTGASRLGDVWLTTHFEQDTGYETRRNVELCADWGDAP